MFVQVLVEDENGGWKLVQVDENKHVGFAPPICHEILKSRWFRISMMSIILLNAVIMATMSFKHDGRPRHHFYEKYYYIEVKSRVRYYASGGAAKCTDERDECSLRSCSPSSSTWKRCSKCGA